MSYLIYLLTNRITGKKYVGKTSKSLDERWDNHIQACRQGRQNHLYSALRKYGEDSFSRIIIDTASNNERASEFESFYIRLFDTFDPEKGYNLTLGGEGCSGYTHTPESLEAMSSRKKEAYLGAGNPFYGKSHTEEAKDKSREWHRTVGWRGEKSPRFRTDLPNEKIKELYLIHRNTLEVARQMNANQSTIYHRCLKMGIL